MDRVIREGQVAVLVSPGFGAGWYTWHDLEDLLYDPVVVNMVETEQHADDIVQYCNDTYGTGYYYGGADSLTVAWVPAGTRFYINEYDGAETVVTEESMAQTWITA
jgi:hypothetical protein